MVLAALWLPSDIAIYTCLGAQCVLRAASSFGWVRQLSSLCVCGQVLMAARPGEQRGRWGPRQMATQVVARKSAEESPFVLSLVIMSGGDLACRGREALGEDTGGHGLGLLRGDEQEEVGGPGEAHFPLPAALPSRSLESGLRGRARVVQVTGESDVTAV